MPDMLAIISKAVFEKEAAGKKPGDVLASDRYRSNSKHLAPLASGGRLFLVTVRPPNEELWLVAVLEGLRQDDDGWLGRPNRIPITDLTGLIPQIRFESGKGLQAAKGALGMSLQTPRALSAADVALFLQAAGGDGLLSGPTNLTAHEEHAKLPCLCRRCLPKSPERAETGGLTFLRAHVETDGRVLYYWLPEELSPNARAIAQSVRGALVARIGT
ncbi:hypothetical protein [Pyxidicoccus xibeiensis]|uniref:hypothetical protein n=1 Tax=Pyxidicoccus xibeiensis TaxID=2906759 RepID=UPI0020A72095|nr:hypothetical protein [Pyxidicoccus xibeiensis]MCP3135876.1 hypothetical protein [Pyxidicoccus xibeiensis]